MTDEKKLAITAKGVAGSELMGALNDWKNREGSAFAIIDAVDKLITTRLEDSILRIRRLEDELAALRRQMPDQR